MFQATFLDPDLEAKIKNINKLVRYNTEDPFTKKMLQNLERSLRDEKRVVLIDGNSLYDRIVARYNGLYDVADKNDGIMLLMQCDANKEEQINLLKQRKEQGFCDNDLFAIDYELIKTVIPKLLETYRRTSKHVPEGISEGEWDTILRDITWLCNEYVTEFTKNDNSDKYKERLAQAKKSFAEHFMELL